MAMMAMAMEGAIATAMVIKKDLMESAVVCKSRILQKHCDVHKHTPGAPKLKKHKERNLGGCAETGPSP